MAMSYQHLRNYSVPEAVQQLSPKDAAFYALSVGFGQNPLDTRELGFVNPVASVTVVPSMALVMGYPGFWLGWGDTGVDAAKVSHVEQEIVLHRPLPVSGRIAGHTRVTGLYSRGEGKGLVLKSQRQIVDFADATLIATLRQVHFLRGDECEEAPLMPASESRTAPSGAPLFRVTLPIRPEQALLYRLNGDMNPLHTDPTVAARAGFERPILHGMCTFAFVTRAVVATLCKYQPERIKALSMRFRAPVFPDETLEVSLWPCGALQARVLERDIIVIDQGQATLINIKEGQKQWN